MSKLPIIVPAAATPPAGATASRAMVPVPSGRSVDAPRPLMPVEDYRTRQFGAEARRPAPQYGGSGPGLVLDAEFVSGLPRTAEPTAGALFPQLVARTLASDETAFSGDRSAMAYGSEAYRRAGAEPSLRPETASVVNLAV